MTTILLPWPSSRLNQHAKGHWRAKAAATKAYRRDAFCLAKEAKVALAPEASLTFTYHPPDRRRRDVHNMPGMLKAAIDGIADAMGCDDNRFLCFFPPAFSHPVPHGSIFVRID